MAHQVRFRQATSYAKWLIDSGNIPEIYEVRAERKRLTVYNVAIKDFFNPPEVVYIDLQDYTGKAGEDIIVRALDDIEVVGVHVILRKDGEILEEGDAIRDEYNAVIWRYTTQKDNGIEGTAIEAYAMDRPGNVTKGEVEL